MKEHEVSVKEGYEVLYGGKGQKQVRFWPKIMPVSVASLREILSMEFNGVNESELIFQAGIVNFYVEHKPRYNSNTQQVL